MASAKGVRWQGGGASSGGAPNAAAGWSVASVSAETQNLEQVFRDLMGAHVVREGAGAGAASEAEAGA